jgi:hypothetical protein
MDISKLPRLSQTSQPAGDAPPPDTAAGPPVAQAPTSWCTRCHAPNPPGTRYCGNCGAELRTGAVDYARSVEPGAGAEAWVSIAVGAILLFMAPNFIRYLLSPGKFDQKMQYFDATGAPLAYTKTVFFWGDLSLTLFAFVLIVEGLVIAFGRRPLLVLGAFILTITATTMNLFYVGWMMSTGYGFQIMSGLAVAFGVYIALYQWRLWNTLRRRSA